jgi:hypothetical protein
MNVDSRKKPLSREERAAAALRENLRKRKEQAQALNTNKIDQSKDIH